MKRNVSFCGFTDAFRDMGRENSFTYDALKALYEYLEQLEDDCGTEIELDVVALDCEYTEYETATESASNYFTFEGMTFGEDGEELSTAEEVEEKAKEFLQYHTTLIEFDGGVIIANF